jgi:hypothetical protein
VARRAAADGAAAFDPSRRPRLQRAGQLCAPASPRRAAPPTRGAQPTPTPPSPRSDLCIFFGQRPAWPVDYFGQIEVGHEELRGGAWRELAVTLEDPLAMESY